jgi:hypothetical protein
LFGSRSIIDDAMGSPAIDSTSGVSVESWILHKHCASFMHTQKFRNCNILTSATREEKDNRPTGYYIVSISWWIDLSWFGLLVKLTKLPI